MKTKDASSSPPLGEQEEAAIAWHADQQVRIALREGIITEEKKEEHWLQSAGDLLDDPELLAKMVAAHLRAQKTGRGSSMQVVLEHYGMLGDARDRQNPTAKAYDMLMGERRGRAHRGAATMAAALTLSTSLGMQVVPPPPAQAGASAANILLQSVLQKRDHELPPEEPPKPVRDRNWVGRSDKRRKNSEGMELC